MSNIIEQLDELSYSELLELKEEVTKRIGQFLPFRIKLIFKQCGKADCTCQMGTSDEGYWHGPYLTARWREHGKTKTASLGREYSQDEIEAIGKVEIPAWYDFRMNTSDDSYNELPHSRKMTIGQRSLDNSEFLAHYGLEPSEDSIGRPRYIRYDDRKFKQKLEQAERSLKIASSPWAKHFSVGTWNGIVVLDALVKRGYYFKS